jgi:hypothetical protein
MVANLFASKTHKSQNAVFANDSWILDRGSNKIKLTSSECLGITPGHLLCGDYAIIINR